ncbi:aminotransferase class I/II-fold pyridoxal phosphate-dependent enzyme [Nonlabens mediterrranea]|uniref:Aminotransferase class I/II-fold pyridoxal phosphate-dependent enzyme n=1 Tax=Nonlabens mediterrranea TaxID=1419947 RepID=A0ABS0A2T4_9FLAO|nr:aminotransferase class I/II-fold pyridoxal phosphate-dependent enzyme [Nonlabens mediterrranea]
MINSKLPNTSDSIFSIMSRLAHNNNALNLSQGFPSFPVDLELKEHLSNAIEQDHNQYAPMAGLPQLRESISLLMENIHNANYDPNAEICITAGATQAIYTAIQAIINHGDEVIVFTPAYDSYIPAIQMAGGTAIELPMTLPDFKIDWQMVVDHINQNTAMIMINSPHNPSGTMLDHDDMIELERIAEQHDLIVLSDEVYEHITFDENIHLSAARYPKLKKRSFITASFGKTFHITGWKTGYCLAPKHLMKEFYKVHQYLVFSINHPAQVAIANYIQNEDRYLRLGTFYQRKRDLFLNAIEDSKFSFSPAQGTYFQLLNYSKITDEGDVAFANRLTIDHKIASIPISVFMNGADPKMLRFCFAKEDHEIIQAAHILNSL